MAAQHQESVSVNHKQIEKRSQPLSISLELMKGETLFLDYEKEIIKPCTLF